MSTLLPDPNKNVPVAGTTTQKSDLVVFLDMNHTLIYADDGDDYCCETSGDHAFPIRLFEPDDKYTVYKRPHLDAFLREISTRFKEVHIFTTGAQDYADAILDRLDPHGTIFAGRWYRESCDPYNMIKDPTTLAVWGDHHMNEKRFVQVDDLPEYLLNHPHNAIIVPKFYNSDAQCKHEKVLPNLLKVLLEVDGLPDVRSYFKKAASEQWKKVFYLSRMKTDDAGHLESKRPKAVGDTSNN